MARLNSAVAGLQQIIAKQFSEADPLPPLYERFGTVQLPSNIDLTARFVDLDVILTSGEVLAKDEFSSLGGVEAIAKSGRIKTKLVDIPFQIPKLEAKSILANPSGGPGIKFRRMLDDAKSALIRKICAWIAAGPTIATDKDYDPDYIAPLKARDTTSETLYDPQDMSIVAGTDTNSGGVNFTGAGKTVSNIETTIAVDMVNLGTKVDTFSDRSLLHNDGSDKWTLFVNPAFAQLLKANKDYVAAAVLDSDTYANKLAAMGVDIFPTARLAWTGAVDATSVYALVPNVKENLFLAFLPGGQPQADPLLEETNRYTGRVWAKFVAFAKPHTFDGGSTIEKAVARRTVTPNGA
jgi:hypothetical protein